MKSLKAVAFVLIAALAVSCAAKIPQKDIDAANTALADAQTAKADVYAATEYQAAMDAKTALDTEIAAQEALESGKSFKQTSTLAKALLDAANTAKAAAATGMETVKGEVATLLTDAQTVLATVKAGSADASANAKKAKKAGLDVNAIVEQVATNEQAITDASAANDAGDYATAQANLTAAKDVLAQLQSSLEAAGFTAQTAN